MKDKSVNRGNLLILFLVGVVIISTVILTSFSSFSSIDNGKNGISVVAKVPDRIAPTCGSIVGESSTWTKDNRQISVTCNDNRECEKGVYITTFDKTTKTTNVTIKDKAGNSTNCPVSVYVDKTAPTCGTITGASTTWTKDNRTVSVACSDTDSTCSKTSFSNTFSTTVASNGVGYITISDVAGNTTSCPVNVYVDKTAPSCGSVTGASTTWTKDNRTISVACSDLHSKCSKTSFSNTYSTTTQTSNITISDNVGNTATCPVNVYVDKTAPSCGSVTGASTIWTTSDRTVSVACSDSHSKCSATSFSKNYTTRTETSSITISDNVGNTTSCSVNVYAKANLKDLILGSNNSNVVTSGNGLYKSTSTNNNLPTYYYSGSVENNYVKFANQLWRIIRVNEDGSIRLIRETNIGGYMFNSVYNNYKYMYYSESNTVVDNYPGMMKRLSDWYASNIGNNATFDKNVVTSEFCEQAKINLNPIATSGNASMVLSSKSYKPTLTCTTDGNGKGILKLKVGLITSEEAVMSGIPIFYKGMPSSEYKKTSYLFTGIPGDYMWTMSPGAYEQRAVAGCIYGSGVVSDSYVTGACDTVRPVISLKSDVRATGVGSSSDPYVIINN